MAPVAGSSRSWALLAALTSVALLQPAACQRPTGDGSPLEGSVAGELLTDVWSQVVQPTLAEAHTRADALADATDAWATAEATGDGAAAKADAQQAWIDAMTQWQRVEVMQLGPAGSSLTAMGGLDLRDEIYSWPTVNRCRVDQETVERGFDAPDFFDVELVNVTGLDALETLLFSPDDENGCPPQVAINANGDFAALGDAGVRQNRADYAAVLAARVVASVASIEADWEAGFAHDLASAGSDNSSFASQDEAINAVFDALFYLETSTKDRKLAEPLGLRECGATSCLHVVETPLATGSDEWIRQNLIAFRALYTGGEGTGLDDLLVELGHEDVAQAMLTALDDADDAAAALAIPVDEAVLTSAPEAMELFDALAPIANLLKGDVATVLFLQIPDEAAGDND